jgi:TonB family protein
VRILIALSISTVLHFGILSYLQYKNKIDSTTEKQKPSKTHIRFVKLTPQSEIQSPKKKQESKPTEKISQEQKQTLPKIIELPKEIKQLDLPILVLPKEIKKIESKPVEKMEQVPIAEPKKEEQKPQTTNNPQQKIDHITNSYLELYKDDFDTFPAETKIYLIKNIKDIGRITQRFLIYPYLSIQAKQSGINVVEFTLYPNGKISEPKIIKSSKYYILDDNSIETIKEAYRDYPRPDKPTIIRIYVKYELI